MGCGFVGEFVADARRGHASGLPQEQGAAQLPLQRPYLRGDSRLGETEQSGGAGEGAGPVHGHEGPQQGQIHVHSPLRPPLPAPTVPNYK